MNDYLVTVGVTIKVQASDQDTAARYGLGIVSDAVAFSARIAESDQDVLRITGGNASFLKPSR